MSSGKLKKALLIGINYTGTDSALNGCINDTLNLKSFLLANNYFKEADLTFLTDNTPIKPTKQNIWAELNKLVKFAKTYPTQTVELFVSYSGHGTNVKSKDAAEIDGMDECLCPIDFLTAGLITDNELRSNFVDKLGPNVRLVFLGDNCMSGTLLDLRYNYRIDFLNRVTKDIRTDTKCDVIYISGCRDEQTSADAFIGGKACGAMTYAFINSYKDEISTKALITAMRAYLKTNGYTQVPQVSSGKLLDVKGPFLLSKYND